MLRAMSDGAQGALEIQVNGEAHSIDPGATVAGLVVALGFGGRRVAVALNREIVPRSRFESVALTPGDRVEILQAVGGGI